MVRSKRAALLGGKQSLDFLTLHGKRVFARNFAVCEPTSAEAPRLEAQGVENPSVRQYLLWRRSLLLLVAIPGAISALLHIISTISNGMQYVTAWGVMVLLGYMAAYIAVPVTAVWAALHWAEQKRSRRILTVGWMVAFLLPMVLSLSPINWMIDVDQAIDYQIDQLAAQNNVTRDQLPAEVISQVKLTANVGVRLMAGTMFLVMLLPAVLSLIPGTLRACVRIKTLLPESIVPGWFLVIAAPLYSLILLLLFVMVNQVAGNLLLIFGVLLLVGAPCIYLGYYGLFVHPLAADGDRRRLDFVQALYLGVATAGALLLVIYFFTAEIFGKPIVGAGGLTTPGEALWNIVQFWINYLSRALFITAVATDLFMMVTVSVWRNMRRFETTPEGQRHEDMMGHLYKVVFPHRQG